MFFHENGQVVCFLVISVHIRYNNDIFHYSIKVSGKVIEQGTPAPWYWNENEKCCLADSEL